MNNYLKILVLSFMLLGIIRCKPFKSIITINQVATTNLVIARLTSIDSTIYGFKFPSKLIIKNNSSSKKHFVLIDYNYRDSLSNWANRNIELYKIYGEALRRISNNERKIIPSKESLEFIFYTRHFIDSSKSIQQQFKPYVAKMLAENKDTLHVGTVTEFKKKHAALFEKLTKGDSISIQFLDNGKFGERVTVPVEW